MRDDVVRLQRARRLLALLIALAGLCALPVAPAAGGTPPAGMQIIGKFTPSVVNPAYMKELGIPYVSDVALHADTKNRVLYAVDDLHPSFVAAYDLDTFTPLGPGITLPGQSTVAAVIPDAGGLVVATNDGNNLANGLTVFGVRNHRLTKIGALALNPGDLKAGVSVVGLAGVPGSPVVYVESAATRDASVTGTLTLSQVDMSGLTKGAARITWVQSLPDCRMPLYFNVRHGAAVGYVAASHSLFFGCAVSGTGNQYQPPFTAGAGRVVLKPGAGLPAFDHFELFPIAGAFEGQFSMFDDEAGRLLIVSDNGSTAGFTMYAFDAKALAWVGGVGLGPNQPTTAGLDPVHGRAYLISANRTAGLIVTDVRPTPPSQGVSYPKWATAPDAASSGAGALPPLSPIVTDPSTRRVFIGPYSSVPGGKVYPYVYVARDNDHYFQAATPDDPDANTADVAERPGATRSTWALGAQGYGAIYRNVGGAANAQFNVFQLGGITYPVGPGTREVDTAFLDGLGLNPGVATAKAIAADRDSDNTGQDMAKAQASWPITPAQCSDFGDKPTSVAGTDATVACDASRQVSTARIDSPGSSAGASGAVFGVHDAHVVASVTRDLKQGAVSKVTSSVHGVSLLGGVVRIGEVIASATTVAHGRPGTAHTAYTRAISDVTVNGTKVCDAPCSTEQIAAAVNTQFPGRLRIDFPEPDATDRRGSPGGYQAVINRDPVQQQQEVFLNEQAADRKEVPAMTVTIYSDNRFPSRTVLYLAGVEAESRYGIFPIDSGSPSSAGSSAGAARGATSSATGAGRGPTGDLTLPKALAPSAGGASPQLASPYGGIVGALRHGLHLAVGGLRGLGRLLPIWLVLLAPVYLSARRRLLLTRESAVSGGSR